MSGLGFVGHAIKVGSSGLLAECLPDTLYSWGNWEKIRAIKKYFQSGKQDVRDMRTIYSSRTPLSSFAYGNISIRMKLKKGVKFKFIRPNTRSGGYIDVVQNRAVPQYDFWKGHAGDHGYRTCSFLSKEEINNTILINWAVQDDNALLDFPICSREVVESWSYGQPEHYEDAERVCVDFA